jgi:hypothetical protein
MAGLGGVFAVVFVLNHIGNVTGSTAGLSLPPPPADATAALAAADPFRIPPGTKARYHVVEFKPIDLGDIVRTRVRIMVPAGLSRPELEANLRHAIKTYYDMRPVDALALFAYREGSEVQDNNAVAKALFVPDGDWLRAAHGTPISEFAVKIEIADKYFQAVPADTPGPSPNATGAGSGASH